MPTEVDAWMHRDDGHSGGGCLRRCPPKPREFAPVLRAEQYRFDIRGGGCFAKVERGAGPIGLIDELHSSRLLGKRARIGAQRPEVVPANLARIRANAASRCPTGEVTKVRPTASFGERAPAVGVAMRYVTIGGALRGVQRPMGGAVLAESGAPDVIGVCLGLAAVGPDGIRRCALGRFRCLAR